MAPRKPIGRSSHPTEPCRQVGEGGRGATQCQGHPLMPTLSPAPARHPMPRVDPLPPAPGKGLPGRCSRRKRLLCCLLPIPAVLCPPSQFSCMGTTCPGTWGWGAVPAGLWSLLSVPCARVGPPPPAPHPAHPAVLLLPTLWLAPKCWVTLDEGLTGLSGGPTSPGSGGGATLGQSPPSIPIQEPVPAGLEMLYI